jgi:hypothetical protein
LGDLDLTSGLASDVLSNVLANLLCVGVPLVFAVVLYRVRGRRRLRAFFGIVDGRHGTVQVRLSNIPVKPEGTFSQVPIRSFLIGSAIATAEYRYALELSRAIQSRPFVGALYALLEQLGVRTIEPPVSCRIGPSLARGLPVAPPDGERSYDPVDFGTDEVLVTKIHQVLGSHRSFVLVGSPVYNLLTYYVLNGSSGDDRPVEFCESSQEPGHHSSAVKVRGILRRSAHVLERRETADGHGALYEEYFLVQKIRNWNKTRTTIFICAGTSLAATAAALDQLADWKTLARDFGMDSFAAVYCLRTDDREPADLDDPSPPNWILSRVWCQPEAR